MRSVQVACLAAILSFLVAPVVLASGPTLEPGKWRTITTVAVPMMPEPQTITSEKCIAEEADSDPLAALVEQGGCRVKSREVSGNTLRFEVECRDPSGGHSTGKGAITAEGGRAHGSMEIAMSVQGQAMTMSQTWESERIGDCE